MSNVRYPYTFKRGDVLVHTAGKAYVGMKIKIIKPFIANMQDEHFPDSVNIIQRPPTKTFKGNIGETLLSAVMPSLSTILSKWRLEAREEFKCKVYDFAAGEADVLEECDHYVQLEGRYYGVTTIAPSPPPIERSTDSFSEEDCFHLLRKSYTNDRARFIESASNIILRPWLLPQFLVEVMGILKREYDIIDAYVCMAHAMYVLKDTLIVDSSFVRHIWKLIHKEDYEYMDASQDRRFINYIALNCKFIEKIPRLRIPVVPYEQWMGVYDKKIFYCTETITLEDFNENFETFVYHGAHMRNNELYTEFLKAQKRYVKISALNKPQLSTDINDTHTGTYQLTPMVLACMIGHIGYSGTIVVLDSELRPRAIEKENIDDEDMRSYITKKLRNGVSATPCPSMHEAECNERTVWLLKKRNDDTWVVKSNELSWDPFDMQIITIETGSQIERKWALFYTYDKPCTDYIDKIQKLLDGLDSFTYSRLRYMIRHYIVYDRFQILNPRFTTDRDAFRAFQTIYMYLGNIITFRNWHVSTTSPVLWWEILSLFVTRPVSFKRTWKLKKKEITYKLKNYQRILIDRLHEDTQSIKFVWLDTGLGKTKVVINYLRELNEKDKMSKYVIWVSARSSLTNIQAQLSLDGFKAQIVTSTDEILPECINLISHTRFAKFNTDSLITILRRSIYVLDECHLAFADSMFGVACHNAVQLAALSINMTGTLYRSLTALNYLAKFMAPNYTSEITKDNYLVVVHDVISKKVVIDIVSKYVDTVSPKPLETVFLKTQALVNRGIAVFVAVSTAKHQAIVVQLLEAAGIQYEVFDGRQDYGPDYFPSERGPEYIEDGMNPVVITTMANCAGYNMNRYAYMIIQPEKTNEAVRKQLEGRIRRADNAAMEVVYEYVYAREEEMKAYMRDRLTSKLVEAARNE